MDVYALNSYRNTTVQEANVNCLERGAHSKPLGSITSSDYKDK